MQVKEYIRQNMPRTVRKNTADEDTLIGLPYPYTVPCAERHFDELYYWDTYFTNKALFELGDCEQAKHNVSDILFLIEKFGYMPNGNRTSYLKRSQPPYAALMVDDIYRRTNDSEFLRAAFPTLKKEYDFWVTNRSSGNGLNRYGTEEDGKSCTTFFKDHVSTRIRTDVRRDAEYAGYCYFAECESGWDFTPRFGGYCADYDPVDLNANLYLYEKLFAEYEVLLGVGDGKLWQAHASARAEKMNLLLWDEKAQGYRDYNYKTGELSAVASAASFQPYFAGIAGNEQKVGLENLLSVLEGAHGIFATEKVAEQFQWAYPNVWAPCQYIAVRALKNYGYADDAKRIAEKYVKLIERNFETHGKLFEKYNGSTGGIDAVSEYGTPEMLGWTAGVYLACKDRSSRQ